MKVIGATQFGPPEVLQPLEQPLPELKSEHVLIQVQAATVNPTDLLFRQGQQGDVPGPPYVPGMEISGVVTDVLPTSIFQPGEAVMAITVPQLGYGGYAEYVAIPESWVARKPTNLTFAQAAALPMNGLTALLILDWLNLPAGSWLAVTGGTGAVGNYVIQIARTRGLRVVVPAFTADHELLKASGAELIIPRTSDPVNEFRKVVPDGVPALADAASIGEPLLEIVQNGGKFAALRDLETLRSGTQLAQRDIEIQRMKVSDYLGRRDKLSELAQLAAQGSLTPSVAEILPAAQAHVAHYRLEQGGLRGRLVLQF